MQTECLASRTYRDATMLASHPQNKDKTHG